MSTTLNRKLSTIFEILLASLSMFLISKSLFETASLTSLSIDPLIKAINFVPFFPNISFTLQIYYVDYILAGILSALTGTFVTHFTKEHRYTCKFGSLYWDRNSFCRGWLITGSTGSGKTQCGINILMHEVFKNENGKRDKTNDFIEHSWGGICIDEKGLYWQTLQSMAKHYERQNDLVLLQTKPDYAKDDWTPSYRLNLLSDDRIPANTYASAIANTASSISGGTADKGFFKTQSESNIGWAIELIRSIRDFQTEANTPFKNTIYPSLKNVLEILTNRETFDKFIGKIDPRESLTLLKNVKLHECLNHFKNRYWNQPKDQLGGVQGTIYNYLNYFTNDDVAEVFCSDNTFSFDEIEKGKIVCVAMPQKLQIERRYVCTFLKLLFYTQVLRRFDMKQDAFKNKNLLICWQDEAQRFITEADGNVDVIREAGATTIVACQSKTSLYPPLGGKEKANVTILNLRNRIIFRASDEDCAVSSAEFIGRKQVIKKTKSISRSGVSYSYSKTDTFKVQPHELRDLKDFCGIIYHSSGKFKKYMITPKDPNGTIPKWWYKKIPLKYRVFLILNLKKNKFLKVY